jgi:hypothetical protein
VLVRLGERIQDMFVRETAAGCPETNRAGLVELDASAVNEVQALLRKSVSQNLAVPAPQKPYFFSVLAITISPFVLPTMANSSSCSFCGT